MLLQVWHSEPQVDSLTGVMRSFELLGLADGWRDTSKWRRDTLENGTQHLNKR